MYLESYNLVVYSAPGEDLWTKKPSTNIDPPILKIVKGGKQYKMRKGKFEPPQPIVSSINGRITCSNYKLAGHRYTNCSEPLTPSLQMRKNQHQVITVLTVIMHMFGFCRRLQVCTKMLLVQNTCNN
jgi:hypothetical protein